MNGLNLLSSWAGIKEYFAPRSAQGYLKSNQLLLASARIWFHLVAQMKEMPNHRLAALAMTNQNHQRVVQATTASLSHRPVAHRAVATASNLYECPGLLSEAGSFYFNIK